MDRGIEVETTMSRNVCTRQETEYFFGTHAAELTRLGLQHGLWREAAFACWERVGIGAGATVLDLGCGPGYTSFDLAELVGSNGRVIAIDQSPRFIDYLQGQQRVREVTNIDAQVMDAHHLEMDAASIDVAYARWLLCYVPDPDAVIAGVARVLRSGGVFVVQDYLNAANVSLSPASSAFARVIQVMMESWRQSGGDPAIGVRLPALLQRHGLRIDAIRPLQRIARPGSPLWQWPHTCFHNAIPRLVEQGLLTVADECAFARDWKERSQDESAFLWTPPMVEIIARKG